LKQCKTAQTANRNRSIISASSPGDPVDFMPEEFKAWKML